jgi:hypothetical protein
MACGKLIPFRITMKNPETKSKLRAVLKAAIGGGLIFAALTAFAICGCTFFRGNFFGGLYFWACVPPDFIYQLFIGLESTNPFDSSFLYGSFCVITNSLIGVFIFAAITSFCLTIKKGAHEK